jgi:hypothetical protein
MCDTCKIQWVDADGQPTPDNNPAIGRVMLPPRVLQIQGRGVQFDASDWFPICAEHAKRLSEPGMEHWIFDNGESDVPLLSAILPRVG